jgi:mediator of RNA polymerase II transcription subunit 21
MYASLNYIQLKHPYATIEGQPSQAPESSEPRNSANAAEPKNATPGIQANGDLNAQNGPSDPNTPLPESPDVFQNALREIAQDLVVKEQQVEHLINSLPGLGNSESDQEERMRELELELRNVEVLRERKEAEREELIDMLGKIITKVKRVP